jgi:ATP-dependent DNA helicase RecG
VRKGTTTSVARESDIARLTERRPEHQRPFDMRAVAGSTVEELDTRELREEYAAAREAAGDADTFPGFTQWLFQRELGRFEGLSFIPNAAAILLHGKSPQTFFPGARIELVRYAGEDVDAPVSFRQPLTGTLGAQVDGAWRVIQTQIAHVPVQTADARSLFAPEYPVEALKELVRNLVQHRLYEGTHAPGRIEWYDDRVELSNPGGPFGRASEGELGDHSDYRNPGLTRGLVGQGYVEQLGRGIRRVRKLLAANGNPPLQLEADGFTRVIVRRRA